MNGKLTKAQRWALEAIAKGQGTSPSWLGQMMMERPGAASPHRLKYGYKAQGYGRMGGTMMHRLERNGLVRLSLGTTRNWHPAQATITDLGRAALKQGEPM